MGYPTGIEWCDATWNPIGGCSIKSPGCIHCYAQSLAGTRLLNHPLYKGATDLVKGNPVFNGKMTVVPDDDPRWTWPLKWRGAKHPIMGAGMPSLIFVGDMSDLFHEDRPDEVIDKVFLVMALCPQHTFQVLTKRSERMRDYIGARGGDWVLSLSAAIDALGLPTYAARSTPTWPLPNVWLGTSCEDDSRYRSRWPILAETPAAVRFISYEPAIGPLADLWSGAISVPDWIICGGESGPYRRMMDPQWARDVRDMCLCRGRIAFFMKQMTGKTHIPPDLMVRQFPAVKPLPVAAASPGSHEPQMRLL